MRTDRLPCATAAGPRRTSPPMTTVPVRSLITTRAADVERDGQRLEPGDQLGQRRPELLRHLHAPPTPASIDARRLGAELHVDRRAPRASADTKSGSCSASRSDVARRRRPLRAPPGPARRPARGRRSGGSPARCCRRCRRRSRRATAGPAPARPRGRRVRAAASASACRPAGCARRRSTTRSRRAAPPVCAYGPSCAVTITAATFSIFISPGDTAMPKRSSMFASVCAEKIVCRRSPVLFRPTTRP